MLKKIQQSQQSYHSTENEELRNVEHMFLRYDVVYSYVLKDLPVILRNEEQLNPRGRNRVHKIYGNGKKAHESESEPIRYDTADRGRGNVTYIPLICDNSVTTQN
jgi:hypothetical protein